MSGVELENMLQTERDAVAFLSSKLSNLHIALDPKKTPSKQVKSVGLKSLTQVSNITGVSLNTLTNWCRDKPELFRIVLIGCKADLGA